MMPFPVTFFASEAALVLDGSIGCCASTADSAALSITGDIDLRVHLAMTDWTPAVVQYAIGKYNGTATGSYLLSIQTNGRISVEWVEVSTFRQAISTVAPTVANGSPLWIRATLDVDNGAGGRTATFYTSTDGTTWTMLGAAVTQAGVTSIKDGTDRLNIGAWGNTGAGSPLIGRVRRVQAYNGIAGTLAYDANFGVQTPGTTSFTEPQGHTVTLNGTAAIAA